MNHIWSITIKELRGYFNSAVALIFLATFLAVILFTTFWVDKFFARGIADVRPLFDWLPLLLIFLVAALTMRLWSEEQKTGTIEVLLTLPVPVHRLVLGKFLAGLLLVALALFLTLGLPITIAQIGNLDWGPVIGGYVAALLLASTYLAIGLCISATTDNQIVSLITTMLVCGLLYLPGAPAVANLFNVDVAEILRMIGTGSRFESIARGVLDLRDLAYYAGLVSLFLMLNTVLLQAKRWAKGERTRTARRNARIGVVLVILNVIALTVWLRPISAVRIDLTRSGVYSLTEPTRTVLASLEEPLILRGYFSEKTHPVLAPMVPQIRDLLAEYSVSGGSLVRVGFIDPSKSDELVKEAQEKYNISSVALPFEDRHESSLVNTYFHVLVASGDQYEVLDIGDLVEPVTGNELRLKNLEYEITKAIRKVVLGFKSVDVLFASLADDVVLEAYISQEKLPPNLRDFPAKLETAAKRLEAAAGGRFKFEIVNPSTEEVQQRIAKDYGFQPLPLNNQSIYLHMVLRMGKHIARVPIPSKYTEAALYDAIVNAIQRAVPGFIKRVGLYTPPPSGEMRPNPLDPSKPLMPDGPPAQQFKALGRLLSESYDVRPINLRAGAIHQTVDVLILGGPDRLNNRDRVAVDQFLMRGGAVIVLAGRYRPSLKASTLMVEKVESGMDSLLRAYGVDVGQGLILDTQNDPFPVPVPRDVGGVKVQELHKLPYPFFVRVLPDQMQEGGIVTSGVNSLVLHWASPVQLIGDESERLKREVLVSTSANAWLQPTGDIQPKSLDAPNAGFVPPPNLTPEEKGPLPLAVAVTGTFTSGLNEDEKQLVLQGVGDADVINPTKQVIPQSTPDARLVVVGSSSFASDAVLQISQKAGSRDVTSNLKFIQNLVDWALEDTSLLSIRARTGAATFNVPEAEHRKWEFINYAIALLGLLAVVGLSRVFRPPTIDLKQIGRNAQGGGRFASAGHGEEKSASSPSEAKAKDKANGDGESKAQGKPQGQPQGQNDSEDKA